MEVGPETVLVGATLPVAPGANDRRDEAVSLSTYMVLGGVTVVAACGVAAETSDVARRIGATRMPSVRVTAPNRERPGRKRLGLLVPA